MASRLPVVASHIRPLSDIIDDGVTGLLVPPGDSPALAGVLNRLLSDEPLRLRLAASGRELVEGRYTDRHMVGAHEDLYVELLRAAVAGKTDRAVRRDSPSTRGNRQSTMNEAQTRL
jgi:glycosyltransferase involved in cell wall biosynthesis